jgi:ribosomal protein S18 acetylase RimI-like enzyme
LSRIDFTLRPARPADCARCQEIAVAAWEPIHDERRRLLGDTLYDHLTADWRAAKAAQIARSFAEHPDWVTVACAPPLGLGPAEEVVGFVTFRLDHAQSLGTIGNNAVRPAWQGRGIATALYRHTLDRFRAEGLRYASVVTGLDAGHAPALATYRKVGFTAEVPSVTLYQEL